ncbi:hypothetical protein N9242_03420 [Vicingaceae bacterium]|nr:hypothetical protein [Vicingaceae bacterium]
MNQKYQNLLSLDIQHEYYDSGSLSGVELVPIQETSTFFKNHRILLKQKGSIFYLLYEGRIIDGNWNPTIKIDEQQKLIFGFKFNDALFQTKTDVPFYVNKTEKLIVTIPEQGKFDSENALNLKSFHRGSIILDNTESDLAVNYVINSSFNENKVTVRVSPGLQEVISFEESGSYSLYKDDELIKDFFWNNSDDQYDGFIVLNIGNEINQEFRFTFKAKALFWKYILIPKYTERVDSFKIKEESDKISFEIEEAEEENEGYLNLISTQKVKLQEKYTYNLFVEEAGDIIKKRISFPSVSNIGRCSKDVNKFILITYLNL